MVKFTTGDPERDFFEQNPHWRYLDSSVRLLKKFDKETASMLRWALFYIEDPDSPYHRYSKNKRVELVNNNYLKDKYTLNFDPEKLEVTNKELKFLFDSYGRETMSKTKRDYYERETSYQLLVQQERECSDLKLKASTQTSLARISEGLDKAYEKLLAENESEKGKSRGTQQPGILFS